MFRITLDHGGSIDAAHFEIEDGAIFLRDENHEFITAIAAGRWVAVGVVKGEGE